MLKHSPPLLELLFGDLTPGEACGQDLLGVRPIGLGPSKERTGITASHQEDRQHDERNYDEDSSAHHHL